MKRLKEFRLNDEECAPDRIATITTLPNQKLIAAILGMWPQVCTDYVEPAIFDETDPVKVWLALWETASMHPHDRDSFENLATAVGAPIQDVWIAGRALIMSRVVYPDGTLSRDAKTIVQNAAAMAGVL